MILRRSSSATDAEACALKVLSHAESIIWTVYHFLEGKESPGEARYSVSEDLTNAQNLTSLKNSQMS